MLKKRFYITFLVGACLLPVLIVASKLTEHEPCLPPSTAMVSSSIATFDERINFIQTYLTFDRDYEQLEFSVFYKNNGCGSLPGPSDWDIKLLAKVPVEALPLWTDGLTPATEAGHWISGIADEIDVSGIDSWYRTSGKVVGIDQENSIVAYRLLGQ